MLSATGAISPPSPTLTLALTTLAFTGVQVQDRGAAGGDGGD